MTISERATSARKIRAGGRLEIERDAALAAIEPHKVRALARNEWTRRARQIAADGILDFGHVGAEIRELHAAKRHRHKIADFDDAHPVERRAGDAHAEEISSERRYSW
jgi:hypothetical protein